MAAKKGVNMELSVERPKSIEKLMMKPADNGNS